MAGCAACNKTFDIPEVKKIKIRCPKCRRKLKGATSDMIGDLGVCQKCGAQFEIKERQSHLSEKSSSFEADISPANGDSLEKYSAEVTVESATSDLEGEEPTLTKGPLGWRLLRIVATLLSVTFSATICVILFFLFAEFAGKTLISEYRYGFNPSLIEIIFGTPILLGFCFCLLCLTKWASKKSLGYPSFPEPSASRLLLTVAIADVIVCLNGFRVLPDWIGDPYWISSIVGFFFVFTLGIAILIHRKVFLWRNYVLVSLALAFYFFFQPFI